MSTITQIKGFPTIAEKSDILGEIVSWYLPTGVEVRFSHLRDALEDSGLGGTTARAFLPRNAFARAVRKLTDKRIIRRVNEDETTLRFQFTREDNEGDRLGYHMEAILVLDKETGTITCDDSQLEARAKDAFDEAMDRRTSSDITSIIQRLFSDKSQPDLDLIPIRKQGGAYFVRREALAFVDKIGVFLDRLHGELTRLPIAAGHGSGERVVSISVAERITGLLDDLDATVDGFDPNPVRQTPQNQKAAAERIKLIRFKIASYADYLADEKARLEESLSAAVCRIQCKFAGVAESDQQ